MNKLDEAVRNNAIWCDVVSKTHGVIGSFSEDCWIAQEATPRFYPNVITLSPNKQDEQFVHVERLLASGNLKKWGVEDSFHDLDLKPHGFKAVIDGQWIFGAPGNLMTKKGPSSICWRVISSEKELIRWESAWRGESASPIKERVFLASLLDDHRISILGAFEGTQIIAGAIASRTGGVVGISNIFLRKKDENELRFQCINEIERTHPNSPLVGYESGADLEGMLGLGFESIGPVRVWVKL